LHPFNLAGRRPVSWAGLKHRGRPREQISFGHVGLDVRRPGNFRPAGAVLLQHFYYQSFLRLDFSCVKCHLDLTLVAVLSIALMPNPAKESSSVNDLLKNSSLYREFQAEREEILKHKWIESEKAGHDIGFEQALTDWIIKHRANWRKTRQTTPAIY
jgi:hypothetical protein